ncbi:MAG: GNAT family N-acetyltransferase [Deltaproteobacteria bacterium]
MYRPAEKADCRTIAKLFSIASDGVADYVWTKLAEPGEDILEVAERRYSRDDLLFGYKNCVVAELGGEVIGMMVSFPMYSTENAEPEAEADPVLAPYSKLEQHDSYYISGIAVFPDYRGMGIGTKFLEIAERKARENKLSRISLIVFEQNEGAKRLYERHAFYETAREKVVPHELIHYTGYALLMVKDIN